MSTRTRYSLNFNNKIYSGRDALAAVSSLYQAHKSKFLPPKPTQTPVWKWLKEVLDTFQPKRVEYKVWSELRRSRRKNGNIGTDRVQEAAPRIDGGARRTPRLTFRRGRPPVPEQLAPMDTTPPHTQWQEPIRTQPQAIATGGQMFTEGLGVVAQNTPAQEAWNALAGETPRVVRTQVHEDLTHTYIQYMNEFIR